VVAVSAQYQYDQDEDDVGQLFLVFFEEGFETAGAFVQAVDDFFGGIRFLGLRALGSLIGCHIGRRVLGSFFL